jgi:haloacetate dehalogenase
MARKNDGVCANPKQIRIDVDCRAARPKFDNGAWSPAKISDMTGGGLYLFVTPMDIVPTYAMFMDTNRKVAGSYWHWYFLSQPEPFPERMIGNDPNLFYETGLVGWGATKISDFDQEMLADYRRSWRDPAMIHGSCSDYRAAASIDLEHDAFDINSRVECPTLVFYGSTGQMAQLFDIPAEWCKRFSNSKDVSLPGGHFFVDQFPDDVAQMLSDFLTSVATV